MKSSDIRQAFLNYFIEKGHQQVASSSLIPSNDPTLLFTNAGMVPFKDCFLGDEKRAYQRATSSQRCVRAGGKHNDLENVGYTARHHTFFEMLGNFSFGDYFKRDAIQYGWEFLTKVLGLPEEKLWITVHISDDEAADIWLKEIGVSAERFSRLDEDNFWQMGDTGPCGPSSEIFYDHGSDIWGGPPGSPEEDGDRYIEIWNLVFMQYERQASGELIPLPNPSIDTGMGLERIAAVMQGVHNNYDIDLFQILLKAAGKLLGQTDMTNQSLRVVADHIRSCAFLVIDGVLPSNEGRGYVLRRIIRRALRHGNKLGAQGVFFHQLVDALGEAMGDAYPELISSAEQVKRILLAEEEQFAKTLDKGMAVLESAIAQLNDKELSGELVFKLHDTFGFPTDLTNDIARERGYTLDMPGFERCMEQQRERARSASRFDVDYTQKLDQEGETLFLGYESTANTGTVLAILVNGESVSSASEGDNAIIVLDQTSFYAESGGQAGDSGQLISPNGVFDVQTCTKQAGHHLHQGVVANGQIAVSEQVKTTVDDNVRHATALNHSATHLLHAALRQILGEHVSQQGSLVTSERLRFDFSHFEAVTAQQLRQIEGLVNEQIRMNTAVATNVMSMEQAKEQGAMALFGEKYGDEVRVLSMGQDNFSVELCGGTHASRTGDIGSMVIVSESGVAAGVRRIEAVTGVAAYQTVTQLQDEMSHVASLLKTDVAGLSTKIELLLKHNKDLTRETDQLKLKLANSSGNDITAGAEEVAGVSFLATKLEGMDPKNLRDILDQVKQKLGSGVVVIATENEGKVAIVCGVTKDLVNRVQAGKLLAPVAKIVGGKGGGRPDMAQGGGNLPDKIDEALAAAKQHLQSILS